MRIGLIAPPWIPIPPPAYGGIEQVVHTLARGLASAGHEVTLIAAPGSSAPGVRTVAPLHLLPARIGLAGDEWLHVVAGLDELTEQDVLVDHSGPLGALLAGLSGQPALHVVHGPLGPEQARIYAGLCARAPELGLIAISEGQRAMAPWLPFEAVCHNGIEVEDIPFGAEPGGYLAFLGRMCPEKGAGDAIDVAERLGLPLALAAKCREPDEVSYFERCVRPRLGPRVRYLGEIGPGQKYRLLAGARALVFPIAWPEPFGMVMIEAMACGTPVLATRHGAVPEVVADGVTGFVRDDIDGLVEAGRRLGGIDRAACRAHVVDRFSERAMTRAYLAAIAGLGVDALPAAAG